MDYPNDNLNDDPMNLEEEGEGGCKAAELQARAKEAWGSVQRQTDRAVRESSAYVRENPVNTALITFAFGLVLGLLLNRREPESFKDRYISEPLHQSKGVLLGLLLACGALLRRTFSNASSAAEKLAENVGEDLQDSLKPLRKAARQAGRKFGL